MTFATAPVSHHRLASLVLLALVTVLALVGCGNLGEFDEEGVARQAERYYAEKYGDDARRPVWLPVVRSGVLHHERRSDGARGL